jgi:demethylmenaquinone methyltransferase/2-methoxy-6-polyprenyl-1,4-benzoquinol methylase
MFQTTASTYDLQNRLLSLARDQHWRTVLARRVRLRPGATVADLAVGTGDVALAICARHPDATVLGVDNSPAMLQIARRKIRAAALERSIRLIRGDLRTLPLADAEVDAVTLAFGIRNIVERRTVLSECRRVLRPGGSLYILEMTLPNRGLASCAYRLYFDHLLPVLGNTLSGTNYAYTYLARSVHAFPTGSRFCGEMREAGFCDVRYRPISFGTATIWRGTRAEGTP